MKQFQGRATATVPYPPEQAFALITDVAQLPSWNSAIEAVVERPDTLLPGSRWQVTMRPPGMPRWGSVSTVVENDGGTRFCYETRNANGNPSYTIWQWQLSGSGSSTKVDVSWDVHLETRDRRWFGGPLRRRQLAREVPLSLQALASTQK